MSKSELSQCPDSGFSIVSLTRKTKYNRGGGDEEEMGKGVMRGRSDEKMGDGVMRRWGRGLRFKYLSSIHL